MSPPRLDNHQVPPPAARVVGGVFGFVFAGIGLTVIVFLWTASGFGAPPLVFRIFGSFIAIAFVTIGGAALIGAVTGRMPKPKSPIQGALRPDAAAFESGSSAAYRCPHCGAPLDGGNDISPHGDAKCTYCTCWFNIHGR